VDQLRKLGNRFVASQRVGVVVVRPFACFAMAPRTLVAENLLAGGFRGKYHVSWPGEKEKHERHGDA
jgi:hypothetical protein